MIRILTVVAASLLALALTGCGEDNKPAEPAANTAAPAAPAADSQKSTEDSH